MTHLEKCSNQPEQNSCICESIEEELFWENVNNKVKEDMAPEE